VTGCDLAEARVREGAPEATERADLRAEFSDLVRARLRAAAVRMFAEEGYKGATVRQIARAAGLTHTTFYNYFRSKEGVLYAILAEIGSEVRDHFERLPSVVAEESAFGRWFDDYSRFWSAHRGVYLAFWEAMFADPAIAARTRAQLRPIARRIVEAIMAPVGGAVDPAAEGLILWLHTLDYTLFLVHMTAGEAEAADALAAGRLASWRSLDAIFGDARRDGAP
jgi:AcrR family transcriptional regulator